jgi:hypothetical protein
MLWHIYVDTYSKMLWGSFKKLGLSLWMDAVWRNIKHIHNKKYTRKGFISKPKISLVFYNKRGNSINLIKQNKLETINQIITIKYNTYRSVNQSISLDLQDEATRICRKSANDNGKDVNPTHRPTLSSGNIPGIHFPMTKSGIEKANLWLIAKCLDQMRHLGSRLYISKTFIVRPTHKIQKFVCLGKSVWFVVKEECFHKTC